MFRCDKSVIDPGNVVSMNSFWKTTATLVNRVTIPNEKTLCSKSKMKINAFLPLPQLSRREAVDMCHKFGDDVYIAGDFTNIDDFDNYWAGLQENKKFVEECTYYDNGRLLTWIPYTRNKER